jgi:hypothetical protein
VSIVFSPDIIGENTLSSEQLQAIFTGMAKPTRSVLPFFALVKMVRMAYFPSVAQRKGQSHENFALGYFY